MKMLHTSDWHIGRQFHRVDLLESQAQYLRFLAAEVTRHNVDIVLVAGDIYDRALPPASAVSVLDQGLNDLLATGAKVVLSAGNHDSTERLGFGKERSRLAGLYVSSHLSDVTECLVVSAEVGQVGVYAIPYLDPVLTAPVWGCAPTHQEVLAHACRLIEADARSRGLDHTVVTAHAFVTGGVASDSERAISVGGVEQVTADVFSPFTYTGLGHLHRQQVIEANVRYSGSALPYSFSEGNEPKGAWLVELDQSGLRDVTFLTAPGIRPLADISGTLEQVLSDASLSVHEDSFCRVTLTDERRPAAAMEQVQSRFPHAVQLIHAPGRREDGLTYQERTHDVQGVGMVEVFLDHVRGQGPSEFEREYIEQAWQAATAQSAKDK